MVPTYFRRELRDRVLQRHLRLRTFVCRDRHTREDGYPVRRGFAILALTSLEYWITRPSAQLRTRRVMTAHPQNIPLDVSFADRAIKAGASCRGAGQARSVERQAARQIGPGPG